MSTAVKQKFLSGSIALALCLGAVSCGDDDNGRPNPSVDLPAETRAALDTYAEIVFASYEDSLSEAQALQIAVDAFVDGPTTSTLDNARTAWLSSREPYLQTEVYRFYNGPIDAPDAGPEGLLNAWPLDEAYIDYVDGDDTAGIINDTARTIDADALVALNEQGGEENIATGYHAVEFLLWGQDQSADGPGDRPSTDYLLEGGTAANQDRRGQYLEITAALIVTSLEGLVAAWQPDSDDNYRDEWQTISDGEGLRRVLTGMIVLSGFETGGERLQTALDSSDQEDEHSCFSDNTHRDMIQDIVGVKNVWDGSYTRLDDSVVEGTGIGDVVRTLNPELANTLDTQITASLTAANALVPPFDQEIAQGNAEGRARVQDLITALRAQEKTLQEVFRLLGLSIPEPE